MKITSQLMYVVPFAITYITIPSSRVVRSWMYV